MIYYGVESYFWLKLILLLVIIGLLFFSFSAIMRRILKVEKRKPFSNNHLNPLHKKIDWTIRITFIVAMIAGGFINISGHNIANWPNRGVCLRFTSRPGN
ncbi:DUF4181 domain-containing protein [Sporosarcina sp.]|uniref:DUF4181 domain-containing protein n=1 Tax=Sporosarcina sp. TaxID=49982 RepID=UPI00262FC93B|nr:DUF4181 domain-containing protein [Sporosarcina sp.]